jgi:hypothetical protein
MLACFVPFILFFVTVYWILFLNGKLRNTAGQPTQFLGFGKDIYIYIWRQFDRKWGLWKTPFPILPGLEIWVDVDLDNISELCKVSSPWRNSNIDFLAPKIGDFEKSLQRRITMLASFTMSICCECGRIKIRGRACQRRDLWCCLVSCCNLCNCWTQAHCDLF